MKLLTNDANQMGAYQLKTFVETWVEPVLGQLLLLEQHYETDALALQLASKEAAKLMQLTSGQMIGPELMDELLDAEVTLTVNVGIGATNPQEQINNFMMAIKSLKEILADGALEKYGLDVAEVIKELFGKLGYKDGARFFNVEEEDPRLTAAKQTIEELQSALAQKVSPEMLAKQIEKLDAEIAALGAKTKDTLAAMVEKNMKTFFASGQTAQMIAAVPQLSPVMDGLVEDAGYTRPTPGGVDPDLPVVAGAAPGLVQNPVKEPTTGIEFLPGDGSVQQNTDPLSPALPESPVVGANGGIETLRSDSTI